MNEQEFVTVEKQVQTRYVVDCHRCPYHEIFPAPVIAYYERGKHEETHANRT